MDSDVRAKTVINRASKIKGTERVRDWDVLAGAGTEASDTNREVGDERSESPGTETVHTEYGCEFELDLAEVYFSPRLATERHRVVEQVKRAAEQRETAEGASGDERPASREHAFDMFAGVGPYAVPMAKAGAEVVATDINKTAIEYLRKNAERNGVANRVTAIAGDVTERAAEYENWADRIVMNLPHTADEFLDTAVEIASDDCVIHYYDIQHEDDLFGPGEAAIRKAAEPEYDVEVENTRTVRSYAPHELNVVLDVRLSRT
jgi:tRNA (guanine37-N1)-methyltransferase